MREEECVVLGKQKETEERKRTSFLFSFYFIVGLE